MQGEVQGRLLRGQSLISPDEVPKVRRGAIAKPSSA